MSARRKNKTSAGLLPYRVHDGRLEVFIVHMGGPFWSKKDNAAWSIVKGECNESEEPLEAARREFFEETGMPAPEGPLLPLGQTRQASGKLVIAWAVAAELDADSISSNTFTLEWPPRSGRTQEFPEVDRAAWLSIDAARPKLVKGQEALLDSLRRQLDA